MLVQGMGTQEELLGSISIYSNVGRVFSVSDGPFRVQVCAPFQPRVGSVLAGLANTRQPWAGGRNPVGIAVG